MFKTLFAYLRSLFGFPKDFDDVRTIELAPLTVSSDETDFVCGSVGVLVPRRVASGDYLDTFRALEKLATPWPSHSAIPGPIDRVPMDENMDELIAQAQAILNPIIQEQSPMRASDFGPLESEHYWRDSEYWLRKHEELQRELERAAATAEIRRQTQERIFGRPEQPVWFDEDGIAADNSEAVLAYVTKVTDGKVTEEQLRLAKFDFGDHVIYLGYPFDPMSLPGYMFCRADLCDVPHRKAWGYSEGSAVGIDMPPRGPRVENLVLDKAPYGSSVLPHIPLSQDAGFQRMLDDFAP